MSNKEKKIRTAKLILIIFIVLLFLISLIIGGVAASLVLKYNRVSYDYESPVEREDTFVLPEYPEVLFESEETDRTEEDLTETETETETAETTADTVNEVTETSAAETSNSAVEYEPLETVAAVVNPSRNEQTYTTPSNPDASFANSTNVVSVYGKYPIYKVAQKDPNILNVLVLGTDSRDVTSDRGRSDAMLIASYNKKTGTIKLTSLLRDSLVPIADHDWNRINTAYFFGGVGLAINTVNELYDLDIQNFVVLDLNGAIDFIDYIGGVDISLTAKEAETYSVWWGKTISPGINHLSGEDALKHMRNRTLDSDFGRTQRQRDTIVAVLTQILTKKSLAEIYNIIDYAFGLVKTNMSVKTLASLAVSVLENAQNLNIESQTIPYADSCKSAWYNGMSILSFDIQDAAKRLNKFIYD